MLRWLEEHPAIGALFVIGLILFAPAIIGEKRLDRRVEHIQIPPCSSCVPGSGQYPVYQRPDLTVSSNPWPEGWYCNKTPEGVCLD